MTCNHTSGALFVFQYIFQSLNYREDCSYTNSWRELYVALINAKGKRVIK